MRTSQRLVVAAVVRPAEKRPLANVETMIDSFDVPLSKQHHTNRLHAGMLVTAALLGTGAHSDDSNDSDDEPWHHSGW